MTRLVSFDASLAIIATGCSGSKHADISVNQVQQTLAAAHLGPERVKIVITVSAKPQFAPARVNYCAAGTVRQPGATSFDVDHGRAIVMIFATGKEAADWAPMPECRARPLRVANVIAVPTHGSLSRRLRQGLARLR